MKEENFMAALAGVAERINRNEIDNLLEINWNRITDGFQECCLKKLLGLIDTKMARVLAVRSCLAFYEAYLVECRYDYYLTCWDGKCQFKDFCMVLLRSFENYESFCLTGGRRDCRTGGSGKGADERCRPLPKQLESPYARELLGRLQPAYCDSDGRWNGNGTVGFKSQVAHVLSGLVNIPASRKWKYFEEMWRMKGLAKAYVKLDGRPIAADIRRMFPEYNAL